MVELDINHEIEKPHRHILFISQFDDLIEDITYYENMKVIDRDCSYEHGSDTIFCQLNKDMFGLEEDSYIVLDFSFKNENLDTGLCRN
jgi:ABC-type multidrug transport system ATPase subunit